MEKLRIENFGGIKEMELEIKLITILIGPQGAGKSIVAKLLYFFKNFVSEIQKAVEENLSKKELDDNQKKTFIKFFPAEAWPSEPFLVIYEIDDSFISIGMETKRQVTFEYSEEYKQLFRDSKKRLSKEKAKQMGSLSHGLLGTRAQLTRQFNDQAQIILSQNATFQQLFIPAGRSFFANIQNSIFSFLSENRSFDPFLVEFGSFYENFKAFYNDISREGVKSDSKIDELFTQIINGRYIRDKDNDYLLHADGRRVNLINASSGQQEILPLMIILKTLHLPNFNLGGATLYIEEPEAHLFPIAQKRIVQLLARTFNHDKHKFQIIITTHSPYILSSFNNLLEAGKILAEKPEAEERLAKVVPRKEMIRPDMLVGYSIQEGKSTKIVDKETKLISQTVLDSVSNEIAIEFDKLLDIEF